MKMKAISISVVMLSLATSAALAAGFTEWMQNERMTVTKVDHDGGRFYCAEHQRWTQVSKRDATALSVGDIISMDVRDDHAQVGIDGELGLAARALDLDRF